MTQITADTTEVDKSTGVLAALEEAAHTDEATTAEISTVTEALSRDYHRMKDCEQNIAVSDEHIAALERALKGWRNYRDHQVRRLPGLKTRYVAARTYMRAAEDEQTGSI